MYLTGLCFGHLRINVNFPFQVLPKTVKAYLWCIFVYLYNIKNTFNNDILGGIVLKATALLVKTYMLCYINIGIKSTKTNKTVSRIKEGEEILSRGKCY